jgi:hypothetical protein
MANKEGAKNVSKQKVQEVETIFIHQISSFVETLIEKTDFYDISPQSSYDEALKRVAFLKSSRIMMAIGFFILTGSL